MAHREWQRLNIVVGGIVCLVTNQILIRQMAHNISNILASRITSQLRRGELNPHRIGEIEKKIGFSLNLSAEDVAWAVAVWENRQMYRV